MAENNQRLGGRLRITKNIKLALLLDLNKLIKNLFIILFLST
jgi:hypothetical protein